ncbi:hypothetical protein SNEBB_011135 [Seison nebaliae]|nr:hypothetical protein SNEBB_011135 [Seison nebaliae]
MNGNYDETSSSDQLNRRKKVTLLNRLRSNKTTPRIDSFSSNDTKKFINKDNFDLDENNYFDEDEPPEINSHVPHRSSSSFSSLPSSSTPSKLSQKSNYNEKPKDEQPSLKSQYKRLSTSVSGSLSSISAVRNNEFNSLCPDRCLTVFVVTWNMAGIEKLPENLRDIFLDQEFERPPSVFAIGTQESTSQRTKLFVAIQQILGSEYLLYAESNLGVLYLGIFIQRHLLWHCSPYEKDQISVRAVKQLKTKGAVAVCFYVFGTSFLFINVHLIAGDTKSLERSKNYIEILNSLNLPKKFTIRSNSMTSKKVNERFDCVFWMGDFNSRSQSQTGNLKKNMSGEENRFNRFLHHDEINHYNPKKKISINEDMCEGDITFEPTYKFEIGTQTYIRHAFTDRIFYCSKHKNAIRCCKYSSAKCIVSSDHKPVYGFFDVNIRRPISRIPLSLGMFNRKVYMKAFKSSPNTKKKVNDRLPPKYVKPKTNVKVELKENVTRTSTCVIT